MNAPTFKPGDVVTRWSVYSPHPMIGVVECVTETEDEGTYLDVRTDVGLANKWVRRTWAAVECKLATTEMEDR